MSLVTDDIDVSEVGSELKHPNDVWELQCGKCGEIFRIGEDSDLVMDEDIYNLILDAGGDVIIGK